MANANRIVPGVTAIHVNTDQEIIQITEDKLRLVLNERLRMMEQKKDWIAPLGIVIAVVTVFCTSNFKDAFLKASVWEAIFILTGIIAFGWFAITAIRAAKAPSIDDVVTLIKNPRPEGLPL